MADDFELKGVNNPNGKDFFAHPIDELGKNQYQFGKDLLAESKLEQALRDAKPSFLSQPPIGPTPRESMFEIRRTDQPVGRVTRREQIAGFAAASAQSQAATEDFIPKIPFFVTNRSTTESGTTTYKVNVFDGKVNGEFPSGMGFGEFVLTLGDPNDAIIYVGLTFNPTTLAITSRFVATSTAAAFPESRAESATSGFLYWQVGFTFLDDQSLVIVNSRLGDINFAFSYGEFNGGPALLPIDSGPGWIDLDFL